MKSCYITFTDEEFKTLEKEKIKMKSNWHDFIFMRCLKIRMKGESGKFRKCQEINTN
jgi:hypothetical protein